jgi:acetylornithine deacetylase/succinyl-diaminopimelate desuccinylase-like protein
MSKQGGGLEHLDKPIGIVTGVVGQYRFAVNVIGRANHAGTTPMNMRKDALVAASEIVLAVNKIARSMATKLPLSAISMYLPMTLIRCLEWSICGSTCEFYLKSCERSLKTNKIIIV